jgi:hypothetical protein
MVRRIFKLYLNMDGRWIILSVNEFPVESRMNEASDYDLQDHTLRITESYFPGLRAAGE